MSQSSSAPSRSHIAVIIPMPHRNEKYYIHLYRSGIENSSTITSLAAMQIKVPPAKELNITSTRVSAPYNTSPVVIPIGVARAKIISRKIPFFFSWPSPKFFVIELPRDMAAGTLWHISASIIFSVAENSYVRPKAIPSKMACIDKAKTKTILDRPNPAQSPYVSFSTQSSITDNSSKDFSSSLSLLDRASSDLLFFGDAWLKFIGLVSLSALFTQRNTLGPSLIPGV